MDCEGEEWEILQNSTALQKVSQIRVEYHLGKDHRMPDLLKIVKEMNFRITRIVPHGEFGIAWGLKILPLDSCACVSIRMPIVGERVARHQWQLGC